MPYRQAKRVMALLLPTSGRDRHVTTRNHTVAASKSLLRAQPVRRWCKETKPNAELGIDVGYVRRARSNAKGAGKENRAGTGNESSSIDSCRRCGIGPDRQITRAWASAMPRTKRLQEEMTRCLQDSVYEVPNDVCVLADSALPL
ncbi:hypothetical protein CS8_008180 [Cupriavidus sp. 8B]